MRIRILLCMTVLWFVAWEAVARAQSQAANASIEGTITDASGAVLPGVSVTATNLDTGDARAVVSNEHGIYRVPLLPLGTYRVAAELGGFKKFEQTGVQLKTGQTAVIDVRLELGQISEVVAVTADAPVADPAKIDLGRLINATEIKNLPLVSRNPYNYGLLQAGVTGFENNEFGVPRMNANGTLLRVNYQIDGNTNTEKDRAGLRLLPISEVMVREVKIITSGYAPEFGQTTGIVYNAITPSGTNVFHGSGGFRFRRKDFSARPFLLSSSTKPDTHVNTWTGELGGPIRRDRWHFFTAYENTDRDISSTRVITITPANAALIGLDPATASGVMPATQSVNFWLLKNDFQLSPAHRLTGRYFLFRNNSPNNIGGGLNSTERATDFHDVMDSAAAQLVSTFSSNRLNEFRVQYARRHQLRTRSKLSGSGPAITIQGAANFGGPTAGQADDGFDFKEGIWQVVDNYSLLRGNHNYKIGTDLQFIRDDRRSSLFQLYTFPTVAAYLSAKSGANPFAYSSFQQLLGQPAFGISSAFYSFFAQDDWRLTPDFKILYGVRYDLFSVPQGRADSPLPISRKFKVDKNNIAPRVGIAWALGPAKRTVLRASSGIMYDAPYLRYYEDAYQLNGNPRLVSLSLNPTSAGAPAFPNTLANLPPGFALPTQSIAAVAPDFANMYTFQNNIQLERAVSQDFSFAVGYIFTKGTRLPVVRDINLINPVGTLADGRPIFDAAVNAGTRTNPQFNHINVAESVGNSTYHAGTLQVTKRFSHGVQLDAAYTYAHAIDDAPMTSTFAVSGDDPLSDPTNRRRDRGNNAMDVRHTFTLSSVLSPSVSAGGAMGAILNHNQVGIIMQFNSGLPFNIRANQDLNKDGISTNDRPLEIGRNTGKLPNVWNVDLRYSRFMPFGKQRVEITGEFKNVFNRRQIASVNSVVATDAAGVPRTPIPEFSKFPPVTPYDQRQFGLGFKVHF